MKVIVITGSRKYTDPKPIRDVLAASSADILITGDAPGADSIAYHEARKLGIRCFSACARWENYGTAAGGMRNLDMVSLACALRDLGAVVECCAFPLYGCVGTWNCKRALEAAGFDVEVVE